MRKAFLSLCLRSRTPRSLRLPRATPLVDLGPEIRHYVFQRREDVWHFLIADVLVVALTGFIVEAKHAHLINHKGQAIFELVAAAWNRAQQSPDHNFSELTLAQNAPFAQEQPRPHVGVYTNIDRAVNLQ